MSATLSVPAAQGHVLVRYRDAALAVAIFTVAVAVRLHDIGTRPYWIDEVYTVARSSQPFFDVMRASFVANHSPLYFLILTPLTWFGDGEAWLRLPSALFGALACPVAASIAMRLGGRAAGAMTGLLMALSPTMVIFGQEARAYALLTLLIAISLHGLTRIALAPQAAGLPFRDADAPRGAWATYMLAATVAANTEGVALFWPLAGFLAMLAVAWQSGANRRGVIRNSLIVHAGIAILCAPCYLALTLIVTARRPLLDALSWIPPLTGARIVRDTGSLFLFQLDDPMGAHAISSPVAFIGIAVAVLAVCGLWFLRRRHAVLATLSIATLTVPIAILIIAIVKSYWMPRYLLFSTVPFFVIAGIGVATMPARWRIAVIAAVAILGVINLAPLYRAETNPRWDVAAAMLKPAVDSGDLLLFNKYNVSRRVLDFYLRRIGSTTINEATTIAAAQKHLAAGGTVWAVHSRSGQLEIETLEAFRRRIAPLGPPAATLRAGDGIDIVRFNPR